jgi:hypothetical protein
MTFIETGSRNACIGRRTVLNGFIANPLFAETIPAHDIADQSRHECLGSLLLYFSQAIEAKQHIHISHCQINDLLADAQSGAAFAALGGRSRYAILIASNYFFHVSSGFMLSAVLWRFIPAYHASYRVLSRYDTRFHHHLSPFYRLPFPASHKFQTQPAIQHFTFPVRTFPLCGRSQFT